MDAHEASITELWKQNRDLVECNKKLEARILQAERALDSLTTNELRSNDYYGYSNLYHIQSIMREILRYLKLESVPPDQSGWSVREIPKERKK